MAEIIKTSISIQKTLFDQAKTLACDLNISQGYLFEIAIENFIMNAQHQALPDKVNKNSHDQSDPTKQIISSSQDVKIATQIGDGQSIINQGELYWIQIEDPNESESSIPHPYVIIQDDIFNHSRINTVVACALTSNIKRANTPGNVLLEVGEANLPKQSVVEVSKISTVDKTQFGEYIGLLTERRISQILAGIRFLQLSFFAR